MAPQRLLGETGLPEAGIGHEEHTAELPGARPLPFGVESCEFGLAPDERGLPRYGCLPPRREGPRILRPGRTSPAADVSRHTPRSMPWPASWPGRVAGATSAIRSSHGREVLKRPTLMNPGDVVLSGGLTAAVPVAAGNTFTVRFDRLATLDLRCV
jgi:hypothetical protein